AYAAPPTDLDRPTRSFERTPYDRGEPRMFDREAPRERISEPPPEEQPRPHEDFSEPMLESSFALDDSRPAPSKTRRGPPPVEDEVEFEEPDAQVRPRRSYRDLIKGLVAAAVIIVIGGVLVWQWPNMVALYRSFRAAPSEVARDTTTPTTGPKKNQERI